MSDETKILPSTSDDTVAVATEPSHHSASLHDDKPPRRRHLGRWLFVVVLPLLVIGSAAGFAYQAYYVKPQQVLVDYLEKVVSAKTGKFSASITFRSDDKKAVLGLDKVDVTASGAYDINNADNPKIDLSLTGASGTYSLKADLRALDKMFYFKLANLDLAKTLGVKISQDWYKLPIESQKEVSKCSADGKDSKSFLGQPVLTHLPLKDVKLVSFSEKVSGHQTMHYSGVLDNSKLQSFIDEANKSLTADCKITFAAEDVATAEVKYDLWTSKDFDRLQARIDDSKLKSHVDVTFDTSDYNKPVNITAPAGAKELKDLFSGLLGAKTIKL